MGLRKILVNRKAVEDNKENGTNSPVFVVLDENGTEYKTSSIFLTGPAEVKYDPNGISGSRVWIETWDRVVLKNANETNFPDLVGV